MTDAEERNVQKIRYQSLTTSLIVALQHTPLFVSDQNQGFTDPGVCVPPLRSGTSNSIVIKKNPKQYFSDEHIPLSSLLHHHVNIAVVSELKTDSSEVGRCDGKKRH